MRGKGVRAPSVVGLTGGIAAGKSTVSARLAALGAHVIDADRVGHRILARDGEAYDAVVAAFGSEIVDESGEIVRPRLARLVFGDPERLARLNGLTHPRMAARMRAEIARVRASPAPPPVVVLDAAVLFEAGWDDLCDEVWTVSTAPERALERLVTRRGFGRDEARARIGSQIGNAQREARADLVIRNDGTMEHLTAIVDSIAGDWVGDAGLGSGTDGGG